MASEKVIECCFKISAYAAYAEEDFGGLVEVALIMFWQAVA
jgi:hypothetical protein